MNFAMDNFFNFRYTLKWMTLRKITGFACYFENGTILHLAVHWVCTINQLNEFSKAYEFTVMNRFGLLYNYLNLNFIFIHFSWPTLFLSARISQVDFDRPPIIKTYQRKCKKGILLPAARISSIEDKHHPDEHHNNKSTHQDNPKEEDKFYQQNILGRTHHMRQGNLSIKEEQFLINYWCLGT